MPVDADRMYCPSCWRQSGEAIELPPSSIPYATTQGKEFVIVIYECEKCGYFATLHELLLHEYRVKYHQLLDIILNIRGWTKSSYNTLAGKLWVIEQAVENYFEKSKESR